MELLPILAFVAIVVLNIVTKKKKLEQEQAKQASLNRQLEEAMGKMEQAPSMQAAPYPQRPVLPTERPPRTEKKPVPAPAAAMPAEAADRTYLSPEGTELHEDKTLHGTKPVFAEPAAAPAASRYTPQQLREAFVLKEILDAPLSRRESRRLPL